MQRKRKGGNMIKVEILERKMQELGLNLSSLAQLSGVDKSTLSRILNKETCSCSIVTANRLVRALSLENEEVFHIFFE